MTSSVQTVETALASAQKVSAFMQATLDALPAGMVVLAPDGTIRHVNATWLRFHQTQAALPDDGHLGDNYLTLCEHPGNPVPQAPLAAAGIRAVIAGEQAEHQIDFRWPGTTQWFTVRTLPFREPAPRHVVLTHIDITARKNAEAAEEHQRSYTQALLHSLSALNSSLDLEQMMEQILAAAATVVPSKAGSIILFADGQARVAYHRGFSQEAATFFHTHRFHERQVATHGEFAKAQAYLVADTQSWPAWIALPFTEWIRSSMGVPIAIRGEIIGLLVADSEVPHDFQPADMERLQAFAHYAGLALEKAQQLQQLETSVQARTAELQAAVEQTAAILHNSLDSIVLVHPDLQIAQANQVFYQLFADPALPTAGQSLLAFIHQDDVNAVVTAIQTVHRTSTGQLLEVRARQGSGAYFEAELSIGPTKTQGLVCTIRDITDRKRAQQALAEERNLLRTLIDAIPDVIYIKDREHRFVLRNQAQGLLLPNVVPDEIIGKTDRDFFPPEHAEAIHALERQIFESGQPLLRHEMHTLRNDGSKVWISLTKVPLRNLQGEIIGLAGVLHDISQRKEHEQQLRFYASLQENVRDAVMTTDLAFRIQSWNRAAEVIYGWRAEDAIGQSVEGVLRTQYASDAEHQQALQELAARGYATGEILQHRKDGTPIYILYSVTLLTDQQGVPYGAVAINHDITEQKQAAEALRKQRDFLQQVIDGVPAFITVQDCAEGILQLANQYAAQLVKLTPSQMVGMRDVDLFEDLADWIKYQAQKPMLMATGKPLQQEEWIRGRIHQVTKIPLKNQHDVYDRVLIVAADITSHKEAEATLRQALQKEKALGELKSRFVSIASHEFRTPLTAISGLTQLLQAMHEQMTSEQINQRLEKILGQVGQMTAIMNNVLQLAHSQQSTLVPEQLSLEQLCRTIIDELRSNPTYAMRIDYQANTALPLYALDPRLLRLVITNLITNALKYSPPARSVYVTLEPSAAALVLTVRDEGIGIPESDLAYLFQPFYRAGNVGQIPGTGLGLAIVKEAVERHNGTITVHSTVGVGTTFTVTLPVANG